MKRILTVLIALCLSVTAMGTAVFATEPTTVTRAPNECGEGITWEFDNGVLTITGDGEMDDFEEGAAPWESHKEDITEVVIEGKLTYIGAFAFKNYDALETVDFGTDLYEIGTEAFRGCDSLTVLQMPKSFKIFGEASFLSCENLKEFHCLGRFPSFRQNCLWDTWVTIYYPAEKPWDVELIAQLEEAFKGRVEFLASDGTDPYEPTEAPTEPEETVPETTVPETEAPTQTEPPVTEAPATEPAETAPAETVEPEAETEATEEPQPIPTEVPENNSRGSSGWMLIAVLSALLFLTAIVCLVILLRLKNSGKRF